MYEDNKFSTKIRPDNDALLKVPKRTKSLPSIIRRATKFKWGKRCFSSNDIHRSSLPPDDGDFSQRLEEFSKTFNVPEGRVGPIGPRINVTWVPSIAPSLSSSEQKQSISSAESNVSVDQERVRLAKKILAASSGSILALMGETQMSLADHVVVPPSKTPDYYRNPEYFSDAFLRGSSVSNKIVADGVKCYKQGDLLGAYTKYRLATTHGNMYGMHNLGVMQLHGQGVPVDFEVAKDCFIHCAYRGLAASMSQLGYIYLYGKGVQKDISKSLNWFQKAAQRGNAYAQFQLAGMCFHGVGSLERNTRLAAELLTQAAIQDFAPALFNLGTMYFTGTGVTQDFAIAACLYKRAAKQDHPQAQTNLGVMYAYGLGVSKDLGRAVSYTRRASEHRVKQALHNMGEAYAYGQGVSKCMAKAVRFYFEAAEVGDVEAEYALGCIFLQLPCLDEQTRNAGQYWMERAALHGHLEAGQKLSSNFMSREAPVFRLVNQLSCST